MSEKERRERAKEIVKKRAQERLSEGLYFDPPDEHELETEEEPAKDWDWLDVVAFVIATYQVLLPILGIMFGVFLLIWAFFWLLSIL